MIVIRFGYCPPNPGWRIQKYGPSFTEFENAITFAEEKKWYKDIWISYNRQKFREIDYIKLCELWEQEKKKKSTKDI